LTGLIEQAYSIYVARIRSLMFFNMYYIMTM